jgi:hypothetical protein
MKAVSHCIPLFFLLAHQLLRVPQERPKTPIHHESVVTELAKEKRRGDATAAYI